MPPHNLAPVALFVYNRLDNTRAVVEALRANRLADQTDLFVFSDAPKSDKDKASVEAVRSYFETVTGFKSVNVIKRPFNYYIERNITEGVTEIINKFGKIIVLEDDGVTAKNFLTFMNKALDYYEPIKKIMHIATFTFIKMPANYKKAFIWRYPENTGGGWATWKDRWQHFRWFQSEEEGLVGLSEAQKNRLELEGDFRCLGALKLKPIPWDICWYVALTKHDGLVVNSPRPLIKNNGLFNGTHFSAINRLLGRNPFELELGPDEEIEMEDKIEENHEAMTQLKKFYSTYGKRKRDKALGYLLKALVALRITKLLKKILR